MGYDYLLVKEQEGVAVITLNRPDKRNALSAALRQEIKDVIIKLQPELFV